MKARPTRAEVCPCGSGQPYADCCGPCHQGTPAATAEALMRSRYSAYVLGLADYLLATWHPDTRPPHLDLEETPKPQWLGLEIRHAGDDQVEFVARYKVNGRAHKLHELSQFRQVDGRWHYLSGTFPDAA
ncbi:YchJ family metal-binding protein [Denitratisoma sp. agr-D3]